jgi:hypothetical protein
MINKHTIQYYYDRLSKETKAVIEANINAILEAERIDRLQKKKQELVSLKDKAVIDSKIEEIDSQLEAKTILIRL